MATQEPCSFSPGLYKWSALKSGNNFSFSTLGSTLLSPAASCSLTWQASNVVASASTAKNIRIIKFNFAMHANIFLLGFKAMEMYLRFGDFEKFNDIFF